MIIVCIRYKFYIVLKFNYLSFINLYMQSDIHTYIKVHRANVNNVSICNRMQKIFWRNIKALQTIWEGYIVLQFF